MSTDIHDLSTYENQLEEINELIKLDDNDEYKQLRDDLILLINNIKNGKIEELEERKSSEIQNESTETEELKDITANQLPLEIDLKATSIAKNNGQGPPPPATTKSSKKKIDPNSKFEIPTHLIPLDSDTDGERNKKRRAIKALKSKWRERVKEAVGTQKQKNWQDFVGKSGKKKRKAVNTSASIFRTEDGINARVGVIGSGKSMTEFGERKRFKM